MNQVKRFASVNNGVGHKANIIHQMMINMMIALVMNPTERLTAFALVLHDCEG